MEFCVVSRLMEIYSGWNKCLALRSVFPVLSIKIWISVYVGSLNIKLRVILSKPISMEQCNLFNTVILNVSAIYQQEIVYITSIKSEMFIKCREFKWYGKLKDQHSYLRW